MKKKKMKVAVNNKLKGAFGRMNPKTNKIEINVKAHKRKGKIDKAELASTVKHEMLHVKHPKMTEKEVYKKTAKTKIPESEQKRLLEKLNRAKSIKKEVSSIKKKFKMKSSEGNEPGALINKAKERGLSKQKIAIMGLV